MKEKTDIQTFVNQKVDEYSIKQNLNCAKTTLKTLSDFFEIKIEEQVIDSATCMNGAGRFGAQCGLVEGALMFIGITGKLLNLNYTDNIAIANRYATLYKKEFGSLLCKDLRPQGFQPDNPPNLCEDLIRKSVLLVTIFLYNEIGSLIRNSKAI